MAQEVTFEDQQKINTFSRLNARLHDLEAQLSARKKEIEDLEDAGNELMLLDDERVPLAVGDCFVHLEKDEAEERLQQQQGEAEGHVRELGKQIAGLKASMGELKATLYAKFGDAINLEE